MKVKCLIGKHQWQTCGCNTATLCIWCLKKKVLSVKVEEGKNAK